MAVGEHEAVTTGIICDLYVEIAQGEQALEWSAYDGEIVTVDGQDALWVTSENPYTGFDALNCEVAPGISARLDCSDFSNGGHSLDLDIHIAMAESVEAVGADDPRLPD